MTVDIEARARELVRDYARHVFRFHGTPPPEDVFLQNALAAFAREIAEEYTAERDALVEALGGVRIMLETEFRSYRDEPWAQRVFAALSRQHGETPPEESGPADGDQSERSN